MTVTWTTPSTVSTGDPLTATLWDEQVRDNMLDVGQPSLGFMTVGTGAAIASNASETYPDPGGVIAFDTLTLSKNTSVSGYRMVLNQSGIWQVSAGIRWPATAAATGTSLRSAKLYVNGSPSADRDVRPNVQNVDTICTLSNYLVSISSGGYIDVRGWQNSGSSSTPLLECWLCAVLISR